MADTGMRGTNALQDSVRVSIVSSYTFALIYENLKRGSRTRNWRASNLQSSLNISLKKSISAKSTSPCSVLGLLKRLRSLSRWRMISLWSMSLGCSKIVIILYVQVTPCFVRVLMVGFADARPEEDASFSRRVHGQVRRRGIHGRSLETTSFSAKDCWRCSCRSASFISVYLSC